MEKYLKKPVCHSKGTVNIIIGDPLCNDCNVQFKTLPLEALSDQVWIDIHVWFFFYPIKVSRVPL